MHRLTTPTSILALVVMLLAATPALAQRGGHGGFAGMRGAFGGFSSAHTGGFGGFQGGFINRGGFVGFQSGFIGHSIFNPGFSRFSFAFGTRRFFVDRRFFFPRYGFFGSFGFGYWPTYGYWPGYTTGRITRTIRRTIQQPMTAPYGAATPGSEETGVPSGRYWLIALKDNNILLVTDYWLEDSTLNYVTREGKKLSMDFSKVDLDLTKELNQERGLEFQLPRAKAEYQPQRRDAYGRAY